jgi:hypothetical protein
MTRDGVKRFEDVEQMEAWVEDEVRREEAARQGWKTKGREGWLPLKGSQRPMWEVEQRRKW